jgi:hypothetical protein
MVTNPVKSPTRLIRTWRSVKVEVENPKIMIVSLSLCPGVARAMFIKMPSVRSDKYFGVGAPGRAD